ncbi:unnamed protein product [Pylaiella littoralis]
MRCDGNPEARSRRRAVASLLVFAKELEKAGRISKASKGLLKELIVHENLEVIYVGEALARADRGRHTQQQQQHEQVLLPPHIFDEQIKKRASKSHQELFEICPLEQAHLLSQQDTEALAEGTDTQSLVYGEIDFWSFYDVVKVAADGIDTRRRFCQHQDGVHAVRNSPAGGGEGDENGKENYEREKGAGGEEGEGSGEEEREEHEENCNVEEDSVEEGHTEKEQEEEGEEEGGDRMGEGAGGIAEREEGGTERQGMQKRREIQKGVGEARRDCVRSASATRDGDGSRSDFSAGGGSGGVQGGGEGRRGGEGLKFYDLGSGSGKAVFAAVLAVDFRRCAVGIEVLGGVHRASTRVLKRYRRLVKPVLCSPAVIKLQHGSFLDPECDWSDGDLVFANSTCFAEDTLVAIAERAELLRPGARVVTFTTALKTSWLRVLVKRRYQMSWGPATVFIHQKLGPEEYAERLAERTPFDEDQGFSPASGGARGDNGTGSGNTKSGGTSPLSSAAAPSALLASPAWSLPSGAEGVENADKDDDDDDNDDDDDDSDFDDDHEQSAGSGFGVGDDRGGGGDGGEPSETGGGDDSEAGDGEGVEGQEEDEEGGAGTTRRACCLSSPQRPSHC